jgi:hypothetical protein
MNRTHIHFASEAKHLRADDWACVLLQVRWWRQVTAVCRDRSKRAARDPHQTGDPSRNSARPLRNAERRWTSAGP